MNNKHQSISESGELTCLILVPHICILVLCNITSSFSLVSLYISTSLCLGANSRQLPTKTKSYSIPLTRWELHAKNDFSLIFGSRDGRLVWIQAIAIFVCKVPHPLFS